MKTQGGRIIIRGDFNSCIDGVQPGGSVASLGCSGFRARDARGVQLGQN